MSNKKKPATNVNNKKKRHERPKIITTVFKTKTQLTPGLLQEKNQFDWIRSFKKKISTKSCHQNLSVLMRPARKQNT